MDVSKLKAGDHHYMAYVGPPTQYDFMGTTQFRLLCTLGLRANHYLCDFGCGSLRAGRLFLSYLDEGRYYGIEANKWLIEEAIRNQVGEDLVGIKKPTFDYNESFSVSFSIKFDFIIAQSIFSHTGRDLVGVALRNFGEALKDDGIVAATFVEGSKDFEENGWVYPHCVNYRPSTVRKFASEAGLFAARIPWYHPRQTWYILTKDKGRLPNHAMTNHLTGAVLFTPEFAASWKRSQMATESFKRYVKRRLPSVIKDRLKKWLADRADKFA